MDVRTQINLFMDRLLTLDQLGAMAILIDQYPEVPPLERAEALVTPALEQIGDGWEKGRYALSQVYMTSRMCEAMLDEILPKESLDRKTQPEMAIALLDDFHSLGKTIVYSALRAGGFGLKDFGRCTIDELVDQVQDNHIKILLISTLMLRSALMVKEVSHALAGDVKIVVGGAPFRFDPDLYLEVGADAAGSNGLEAVEIVSSFMGALV